MAHTITLTGKEGSEKRRIWRVLQLLQKPDEWDDNPPSITLVWERPDGTRDIIEAE